MLENEKATTEFDEMMESFARELGVESICALQLLLAYEKLAQVSFQNDGEPSREEFTAFRSYVIHNYKKMREEMGYLILMAESNGVSFSFPGNGKFSGAYGSEVYQRIEDWALANGAQKQGKCYVATAVYGSYDCPQVWVLRRFRDVTLSHTASGRAFIRAYYATSPTLLQWLSGSSWFNESARLLLDKLVSGLKSRGYEDTQYND
ncbi:MAG: hypothetical protein FWD27_03595 [Coriobacteriia bacterium]|nr:hypothetical protein [Coriobacteriia bacterium]